jgi:beta-lactamase class A
MADFCTRFHVIAHGSTALLPLVALFCGPALFATSSLHADEPKVGASATLESQIMPLIKAHQGKVTVAVKHLGTGESFEYEAGTPMPTASLIKLPVMVEVYRQADAKKVDMNSMVTLKQEDKVPGSGVLTKHFTPGATFTLRDAVRLMIAFSDNTATNLVLDKIGIGATAEAMEKLGYPNTKIHSKVYRRDTSLFPERSVKFGLGSTTAEEMVRLCEALHRKQVVSPKACDEMLEHLRECDDKDKFPRFLPPDTKIAFKTGSVTESRTAAGIIECPDGPVALCVMTSENQDKRWVPDTAGNRLCADIAKVVYDHFSQHPAKDSQSKKSEDGTP